MSPQQADWISPPGESISALLRSRQLSGGELAAALELGADSTLRLLTGQHPIDAALAARLAAKVGGTKTFWLQREAKFRQAVARAVEEEARGSAWLEAPVVRDLCRWGWLASEQSRSHRFGALLAFFGVARIGEWERRYGELLQHARFREHGLAGAHSLALTCWLRRGEMIGQTLRLQSLSTPLLRQMLAQMRDLTRQRDSEVFLPALQAMCAQAGVALAVVRAPTGSKVSGAVFTLPTGNPIILLSFRYRSDDQFWFSFFHELGHVILHGHARTFIEGDGVSDTKLEEAEANEFAEEVLVPTPFRQELLESHPSRPREFLRLARRIGVSAGILIGQLQHMGIVPHDRFNRYKARYTWAEGGDDSVNL